MHSPEFLVEQLYELQQLLSSSATSSLNQFYKN